jgi:hypothetical protein
MVIIALVIVLDCLVNDIVAVLHERGADLRHTTLGSPQATHIYGEFLRLVGLPNNLCFALSLVI